ncbi:hypothetical protein BDV25DRAFT_54607 [Aspergillus avenaceus]|uniref:SET domain-containing protein n=1 Tax=Aspergillus avenaceus TaxID=36643 RepID=A0A5N6TIQ8_ASPAV|nr:hypothetical protein BDV25DRAFT_54607 [Aspergillus avenaceus]
MTDTSPVVITHPATEPYPVTVPLNSPTANGAISDTAAPEEEEPYTIKCICAFEDDDGNTVFCEGCETWQHIECYYHGRDVPEVHNCVDCEPRPLDGRRATERQRRLREQNDGGDRKAKRSGSKSQKKKSRDGDHLHSIHHRSESSAREQHPVKKAKTNHRASGSVGSLPGVGSLPPDSRKRTAISMSPTKASGPSIPLYSNEFLHLYDKDKGHDNMDSNLFVNLPLAADLASWVTEPGALSRASNGRSPQDVFTWSGATLDRSRWPSLTTETIADTNIDIDGKNPTWKILKTQDRVCKDGIVGEITGKIGHLRDYCLDPSNRWQELRHPEPFVFFHPQLPLYIDSRHEGNMLRYVRRSCRPNVTIKTYITNGREYHFCFVAKEDITAGSEITAMWYLDPQLFESTNGVVKQESSDNAQDVAAICISNVLSHFGGCACLPSSNCLLSSVDRRRHPKTLDVNSKQATAKRKKTKSRANISPASNSRAGSEGTKNLEDDDQADSRSTSGSVRGQTRSRDLTPTLQTPIEGFGLGESELSARDKRKIAAVEKKFQQLEHDQQASQRKKKRASGQSTQTTPIIGSSSAQVGYFMHGGDRELHSHSHSPPSATSPASLSGAYNGSPRKISGIATPPLRSHIGHQQYVDSATQTEPDASDALSPSNISPRRVSFVPLTQRLLKRCYSDRIRLEKLGHQPPTSPSSQSNHLAQLMSPVSSPRGGPFTITTPSVSGERDDVEMKDAVSPMGTSPGHHDLSPLSGRGSIRPSFPPPWPSTAAHNTRIPANKAYSQRADLRGPLPSTTIPSLPSTANLECAAPAVVASPSISDALQHTPATPGSGVAAPSPVKKKLSLGDYLIRRGTLATPTSEKTEKTPAQTTPMPPPKSPAHPTHMSRDLPAVGDEDHAHNRAVESESSKHGQPKSPDVAMKDVSKSTPASQLSSLV